VNVSANDYDADDDFPLTVDDSTTSHFNTLRKELASSIVMCDPITKLMVQYALYFLVLVMAVLSTTLPFAITNLALLVIMTIIVIRALNIDS
jgi:hypothetical protein